MKITKIFAIAGVLVGGYLAVRDLLQEYPDFQDRVVELFKENFDRVKELVAEMTDGGNIESLETGAAGNGDQSTSGDQSASV